MKSQVIHPFADWFSKGLDRSKSSNRFACVRALEEPQALEWIAANVKRKTNRLITWDARNGFRRLGNKGQTSPIGTFQGMPSFRIALEQAVGLRASPWSKSSEIVFIFLDGHQYLDAGEVSPKFLLEAAKTLSRRAGSARSVYASRACILLIPRQQTTMPAWAEPFPIFDMPPPDLDQLRNEILTRINNGHFIFPEGQNTEDTMRFGMPACDEESYRERIVTRIALYGRGLGMQAFRMRLNVLGAASPQLGPDRFAEMQSWQSGIGVAGALVCAPQVDSELAGMPTFMSWLTEHRDAIARGMRGIAICGPPGTGKSRLTQVLAREMQAVLLRLDLQALRARHGDDPQVLMVQLLERAKDFTPAVLWVDGVDETWGSGVDARELRMQDRVFQKFSDWLASPHPGLFVALTLRDFRSRRTRDQSWFAQPAFDARFFLDLPSAKTRAAIFLQYILPIRNLLFPVVPDPVRIAHCLGLPPPRKQGGDSLHKICSLLGHDKISGSLTGTGIKDAVNRAGREVIRKIRIREDQPQLRWETVFAIASESNSGSSHFLYGQKRKGLDALREAASEQGWIRVD